jgi:hypothetical protein
MNRRACSECWPPPPSSQRGSSVIDGATRIYTTRGWTTAGAITGSVQVPTWKDKITLTTLEVTPAPEAEMVEVTLDDMSTLHVSPSAALLARDGREVKATDLAPGLSLLPLYLRTRIRAKHYLVEEYFEPGDYYLSAETRTDEEQWRPLVRMVAEWKLGRRLEPNEHVRKPGPNWGPDDIEIQQQKIPKDKRVSKALWLTLLEAKEFVKQHKHMIGPGKPPGRRVPRNHKVLDVTRGHCFAEGSMVYVVDSSCVTPVKIEQLALDGAEGRYVLGYDEKKQLIRKTLVKRAWMTKPAAPVLAVPLSNGRTLKVTPEHKLLTVEGGFIEAQKLNKAARLISLSPGVDLKQRSILTHHNPGAVWVADWHKPDREPRRIFDVETETGNLIVDGVVCHNSTSPTKPSIPLSITTTGSGNFSAGGVFITADVVK